MVNSILSLTWLVSILTDMDCELAEAVYCNTPLFGGLQCKYKILKDLIVCQLWSTASCLCHGWSQFSPRTPDGTLSAQGSKWMDNSAAKIRSVHTSYFLCDARSLMETENLDWQRLCLYIYLRNFHMFIWILCFPPLPGPNFQQQRHNQELIPVSPTALKNIFTYILRKQLSTIRHISVVLFITTP